MNNILVDARLVTRFSNNSIFQNNVRLLNSAVINDFTMLTYRQPLRAVDAYDKVIYTNQSQAVIWAVGPVNKKVNF